ncbi:hypothetical protein J2Z37_001260 [Ammoniphilus resinae]|uniref:Uncharacterized protein n=1 Tax=Ammoniphilus resinae TaxID=861532 RepID=A0ABS4GLX0_9BACL|nr:hypothetical protein [Ammoniphilus resinae]
MREVAVAAVAAVAVEDIKEKLTDEVSFLLAHNAHDKVP